MSCHPVAADRSASIATEIIDCSMDPRTAIDKVLLVCKITYRTKTSLIAALTALSIIFISQMRSRTWLNSPHLQFSNLSDWTFKSNASQVKRIALIWQAFLAFGAVNIDSGVIYTEYRSVESLGPRKKPSSTTWLACSLPMSIIIRDKLFLHEWIDRKSVV